MAVLVGSIEAVAEDELGPYRQTSEESSLELSYRIWILTCFFQFLAKVNLQHLKDSEYVWILRSQCKEPPKQLVEIDFLLAYILNLLVVGTIIGNKYYIKRQMEHQ